MPDMGLGNLGRETTVFKRKFRWEFEIPNLVGGGMNMCPPNAAARPKLTFNDFQVNHLVEIITIPGRPVWNPITLTLYDIVTDNNRHPIYEWITSLYGGDGHWSVGDNNFPYKFSGGETGVAMSPSSVLPPQTPSLAARFKMPQAYIMMYDGCGCKLEQWTLENVFPSDVDFGELDYSSSDVATITLTLKYDRAYLETFGQPTGSFSSTVTY